ncbi:NlpC/P60 family protein [Actinoplanes sp. NPDC051861]|uniref:C40 family peptidase n=1 Tax=Actinoplanes sp. NPDC051861 TaxID=3155170 RepID=UPI003436AE6B
MAAPTTPPSPAVPVAPAVVPGTGTVASVPDAGARPVQTGALTLPGTPARPSAYTPPVTTPGGVVSPVVQQIEKGRAEIASLGDQLIRIGQDRDIAQTQSTTATQRIADAEQALQLAQTDVKEAANAAIEQAAAMPPGTLDSGLSDLEALSRLQRGDIPPDEGAARRLKAAEATLATARADQTSASLQFSTLSAQYKQVNNQITAKQTAQGKLEQKHAAELSASETIETAADQQLGAEYLAGEADGRSADPRAIQALQFALAQRGDPYVWSEEGPDQYDCSGLMYAAYRSVNFPLVRVSRDQYYQTRNKVVDRYSLLPGDLLFFSSSNSWTGIHHVAMYAGSGMMVEAPRTGLNVRLVPVRWTRLFQATRIFGSVEGDAVNPVLGAPDAEEQPGRPATTPPTTSPTPTPSKTTTKPPVNPSTSTTPPVNPSTSSTTTPPVTEPTTTTPTTDPTTDPTTEPTTQPTPVETTTTPETEETTSAPTGSTSSSTAAEATVTASSESKSPSESVSPSGG